MDVKAEFAPLTQGVSSPSKAGRTRALRTATWMLVPPVSSSPEEVAQQLVDALKKDTRVIRANLPKYDDHWTRKVRMFPDAQRTTRNQVIIGADQFRVLQLASSITFEVRVPAKNQPLHGGMDDIPSDTYFVAWDGLAVFVLWEQDDSWIPLSGGHVVAQILKDVTGQIGCDFYIQSCTPGCTFQFVHRAIRLVHDSDVDQFEVRKTDSNHTVELAMPLDPDDPMEDVDYLSVMLSQALHDFAEFKNIGRRMIDIEDELREDLAHVLHHFHAHSRLLSTGRIMNFNNLKPRWAARSWRREARALVARIWLGIASIETLRRQWDEERAGIDSRHASVALVFHSDLSSDVEAIKALNLEPVSEMVNQLQSGLDNRLVVGATAWGAIAGGLAGGLVGRLG